MRVIFTTDAINAAINVATISDILKDKGIDKFTSYSYLRIASAIDKMLMSKDSHNSTMHYPKWCEVDYNRYLYPKGYTVFAESLSSMRDSNYLVPGNFKTEIIGNVVKITLPRLALAMIGTNSKYYNDLVRDTILDILSRKVPAPEFYNLDFVLKYLDI